MSLCQGDASHGLTPYHRAFQNAVACHVETLQTQDLPSLVEMTQQLKPQNFSRVPRVQWGVGGTKRLMQLMDKYIYTVYTSQLHIHSSAVEPCDYTFSLRNDRTIPHSWDTSSAFLSERFENRSSPYPA